jgi:hypothetical protein
MTFVGRMMLENWRVVYRLSTRSARVERWYWDAMLRNGVTLDQVLDAANSVRAESRRPKADTDR